MKSSLLKRVITGAVLIAFVVGFFFLRLALVSLFNILVALMIILGSYELSSKLFLKREYPDGEVVYFAQDAEKVELIVTVISSFLIIPAYYFFGVITAVSVVLAEIVASGLISLIYGRGIKLFLKGILSAIYPKLLLLCISISNALAVNSLLALVMIFVVPSMTDTFAYFVGSTFKGVKLCPKISPNKTVSGAIGGLIGGVVSAIALYFILPPVTNISNAWWLFIVIGLVASILTQIGDIFESFVKRKLGIKDMGNIFPGHGGVLDRVDGIMLASVFITIMMAII